MKNVYQKDEIDSFALSAAHSKTMLLADLFVGAGHGESLTLSEAGLAGLAHVLWEIADTIQQAEATLPVPVFKAPLVERRVN